MSTPNPIELAAVICFLGLIGLAAGQDVLSYRIANRVCLSVAGLYPVYVLSAAAPVAWPWAVAIACLVLALGFALFSLGLLGGGDAKLLAAVALWAGPSHIVGLLFVTLLAGGGLALLMVSPAGQALAWAFESLGIRRLRDVMLSDLVPYGLAIAVGGGYVGLRLLGLAG